MNIISQFVGAWVSPWKSMRDIKAGGLEASIKPSILFIVLMGLVAGLVTSVVGMFGPAPVIGGEALPKAMIWLSVAIVPLAAFIGSFLGAFIVWGLITGFLNGTMGQYKTVYRILALLSAYSPVTAAISNIPKVGTWLAVAINIWATIILIQGVVIVLDTKPVRTWVILGVVFGLLFLLGIVARVATERQLQNNPAAADFGAFNNEEEPALPNDSDTAVNDDMKKLMDATKDNKADAAKDVPAAPVPAKK